jgi:hypothetical protein
MTPIAQSASIGTAAQSLWAAIGNTANALGTTANVAANSVEMLGNYVAKHRTFQEDRTKVELRDYRVALLDESADRNAQRKALINERCAKDPEYARLFTEELAELRKLFEPATQAETVSA